MGGPVKMKLSISNIGWDETKDTVVYNLMYQYGYLGLEIAPTRIFPEVPYNKIKEAAEWSKSLKDQYGFVVPSMQSIWFGRSEKIFGSVEERKALLEYTKKAIDFAQIIGCRNLVFGCPRNRNIDEGMNSECAVSFFRELGEYAFEHNTVIGMEANPPIYNTKYVNDTLSAIDLIETVDSKGFLLNLDIGTVIQNEEDICELEGRVHLINHVHISEPGLKPIQKRTLHYNLREILEREGYTNFVSIEMGKSDDLNIIEETLSYVKEIFQ